MSVLVNNPESVSLLVILVARLCVSSRSVFPLTLLLHNHRTG